MACADCVLFDRKRRRCEAGYEEGPPRPCPSESHVTDCDCERCEAADDPTTFNDEAPGADYGSRLEG